MAEEPKSDDQKRDEVLRRMLNTPPKPRKPKKDQKNPEDGADDKAPPKS